MKNKLVLYVVALAAVSFAGCHSSAQIPPASPSPSVNLTWTAPTATSTWAGCSTTTPCTYAIYRDSSGSCDAISNTNWTNVAITVTPNATTYTDLTPPTGSVCYAVETVWNSLHSGPSNTSSVSVPVVQIPLAPSLSSPSVTAKAIPPASPAGGGVGTVQSLIATRK